MMNDLMFSVTCNCGVTITGVNEKGLRKLLTRHINEGQIHACWKAYYNANEQTDWQKLLQIGKAMFDEPLGEG
jgi:hypothetical protein